MKRADSPVLPPLVAHIVSPATDFGRRFDGYTCHAAGMIDYRFSLPEDGIDPLLEPGIDALVIDIRKGGIAALDILRRVIALGPAAPVIAISLEDAFLQMDAIEAGAEDCLAAPLDDDISPLSLAIRRTLARKAVREQHSPVDRARHESATPRITLVQETPEAIVILDSHGIVRFANNAAQEMLGRTENELVNAPLGLPIEPGEHDVTIIRPDGGRRSAEMRIAETLWGGLPARVASLNDVTVRLQLEQTMHEAEARSQETVMRSQTFFSNVNHDLRTPLTHIIGFSEMMKNERLGPIGTERYREYASDIYSSSTMLLDMIEDLLGIAEAETEEIRLSNEICNLTQLADMAIASHRQNAKAEGLNLEIHTPERLPGLRGDAKRLRQGLFRIIAETIHCARPGSTIHLTLREEDEGISLVLQEIRDVSHLTAQDSFPYISGPDDPFVSAENSSSPREEGLALSLARKVIELHGGKFDLARAERGWTQSANGMRISVHFPAERIIR